MKSWRILQQIASVNFKKWIVKPNVWIALLVYSIYIAANSLWLLRYCNATGMRITPWVYPHVYVMPLMWMVFSGLLAVIFSDAPYQDGFSQFLQCRVGRRTWLVGQLLYTLEVSLLITIVMAFIPALMLIPHVSFSFEWGTCIRWLAYNVLDPVNYGIEAPGLTFGYPILEKYSALQAMGLSMLLTFLLSVFMGLLSFAANVIAGEGTGAVIIGVLGFLAYFCTYVGYYFIGEKLLYISPVNWIYLTALDPKVSGGPPVSYAIVFLVAGAVAFWILGCRWWIRKER